MQEMKMMETDVVAVDIELIEHLNSDPVVTSLRRILVFLLISSSVHALQRSEPLPLTAKLPRQI